VITLCCTQKVRRRLAVPSEPFAPLEPTTRLGNWYVNLVNFGRQQLVLATSERSLLTVILPAHGLRETLEGNLKTAVGQLLTALGIPADIVSRELAEMTPSVVAPAANRRVMGSMNEFAFHLGFRMERSGDPLVLALELSDTPMSAMGSKSHYGIPRQVARELLINRGD
jgi:hypothetical protein